MRAQLPFDDLVLLSHSVGSIDWPDDMYIDVVTNVSREHSQNLSKSNLVKIARTGVWVTLAFNDGHSELG